MKRLARVRTLVIALGLLFSLACSTYKHEWIELTVWGDDYQPPPTYTLKDIRITLKDSTEVITVSRGGGFFHSWPETLRQVASEDSAQFTFSRVSRVWLRDGETLRMLRETGMPPAAPETVFVATSGIHKVEYEEVTETKEGVLPKILGTVLCVHD